MSTLRLDQTAKGHVLMMVATVLIATSFPVGAAITDGLDSLVLTFLRFALAAMLFAPIVAWRYGLSLPSLGDLVRYAVLSACLVGFFWGMFAALHHTTALNTATIFAMTPALTALVAAVILRERLPASARLALPLGMLGAVWVVFRGDVDALMSLQLGYGDAIFFAATVAMGFYGPLVKRLYRGEPMAQMTFWTLLTGSVWLLALSAPRFASVEWALVPTEVYGGILYLAVFTTLITFFAVQWSSTIIGPTKTVSYTYLNPVLVLGMGLALGDQLPPMMTYPGFVLILSAVCLLQRSKSA